MDCAEDVNFDLDSIVEEQFNMTKQLMNQSQFNNSTSSKGNATNSKN